MGKRALRPKRAVIAAASAGGTGTSQDGVARIGTIGKESVLSRGKRKRHEKREYTLRKNAFIEDELARLEACAAARRKTLAASGALRRNGHLGPALAGISSLAEAVEAAGTDGPDEGAEGKKERPVQKVVHEKARRRILADEAIQVQSVIEHPSFQADPMEALRQHLMNTVHEDPLTVPGALNAGSKKKQRQKPKVRAGAGNAGASSRGKMRSEGMVEAAAQRRVDKAGLDAQMRRNMKKAGMGSGRVHKPARGRIGEKRPKI
jgi:hypothetical protein